jgi:hypothetical protein
MLRSTWQMADYACKMFDVFNNSLSEIIHYERERERERERAH